MRTTPLLLAVAVLLATRAPRAEGDASADDARRAAVIARVGARTITVAQLEDRLARVPRFQLRTFGATADEIRRKFLDQVLLREALLAAGADDRHLEQDIANEEASDRALANATLLHVRLDAGSPGAVSMEDVQRYYDANLERFNSKDRLNIWRILCATRDEAQTVVDQARKDGTVQTFTKLAREHSLDKATYLRGGNLGFLDAKGISNEPGVTADPALVAAAQAVKDGEIVPAPVQEGTSFAVVWRRGTIAGSSKTVEQVKRQIQEAIVTQRREAAEKALMDRLKTQKVKDVDESLLGSFEVSIDDGKLVPRKRARE